MDNSKMKKRNIKSPAILVLTALIWGFACVAQSVGMDYVGPFTFNAVRCLIGAAVLVPVILFMDKSARKSGLTDEEMKSMAEGFDACMDITSEFNETDFLDEESMKKVNFKKLIEEIIKNGDCELKLMNLL